jgi:thiamine pyrophosphate-dependent acetolactate synthase large subunit-like protein
MKTYQAIANAFDAEGVTDIFGMTGEANIYIISELQNRGARMYQVRHEGAGLAMADGWARMKGRPGVVTTTGGPGCAQLSTTMLVASRARTPLVAFCGDTPWGDDEHTEHIDQERFAATCEAGFVRITSPDVAYQSVQKAFYKARIESRPVLLSYPVDVNQGEVDDDEVYVPSSALVDPAPVAPNPESAKRAADLIGSAEKVVIIVGRGAIRSGAGDEVVELANRTGAIIATSLMAKNWLGDHPFHVGISGLFATRNATELFQDADCVVAVGASMNRYTTEYGYLYPNARFVQIDIARHIVMGDGRAPDCYVHADAKLGLRAVVDELGEEKKTGYQTPETRKLVETALEDDREYEVLPGTIDPREAVRVLDNTIPDEIGMVLGGGQQNHFGIMLANRQRSWLLPNLHFGCIGQGLTTAMGAIIAQGGSPAYLMEGDAGLMMHLAEFETAVRYGIPVMVAVLNDEGYAAEYHHYRYNDVNIDVTAISTPDLGSVGVALGGRGSIVRSADELERAAKEFAADPVPTLVDVRIARDVASIPNRRRYYGEEDQ